MQQQNGPSQSATNIALVNQGQAAVDLTSVKLRYYFTIDGWSTPIFEIDYAGQVVDKAAIKVSLFTLQPAQANADRYFELSFTTGSLGSKSQTEINSRLHDQNNLAMTTNNDYSFVGATGFTDSVTAYVGGQLVWGKEPGTTTSSGGAGGAGGGGQAGAAGRSNKAGAAGMDSAGTTGMDSAGTTGMDSAGASSTGGASDGGSAGATFEGSAGTTSGGGNDSAGSAGVIDEAGFAGSAGAS
jgi:hypothetical protein